MNPLASFDDLQDYVIQIHEQRAALKKCTAFNPVEKITLEKIYDELEQIANTRINHLQELDQALKA